MSDEKKPALELAAGALEQRAWSFLFNNRESTFGKELEAAVAEVRALYTPRPVSEWHEDMGDVLWWRFPIEEPPYVGHPNCDDWVDDYHTHWTPLPKVESP